MIQQSDCVIIIPHLGADSQQEYAFDQCYASLRESVSDMQIVVVKNGPACQHLRDVRVLKQGQCMATNAAVAITNQPWILVTNDDMIYPPGWFEKLVTTPKEIMCVSPMLIEPRQGAPTFQIVNCGGAGGDFDKDKWLEFVENFNERLVGPSTQFRTGFNLPFLIHRDLWDIVGGYDINYDPWGSNGDSDLEYKIRLAGVQPYQNTNCIVYHFSQTSGTFHPDNREFWQRNWDYFIEKWGFPRTDEGIWEATFEIPTKEEGRIFCPEWEGKYNKYIKDQWQDQMQSIGH